MVTLWVFSVNDVGYFCVLPLRFVWVFLDEWVNYLHVLVFFTDDDVGYLYVLGWFFFLLDRLNKKKKDNKNVVTHNALNHFKEAIFGRVRNVCTKN